MKKIQYIFPIILLFSSCVSRKDWVYFQSEPTSKEKIQPFELRYQSNDLLSINVSASDLDAVRPFNLFVSSPNTINNLSFTGQQQLQTYLVDEKGEINFPVLGKLTLGGLSRKEAIAFLENKLQDYIKHPIVTLRLTNFKISVLGEVNNPGTYTIDNEQVSLPQAIALAGDLSITGKRSNILLLREEDGVLTKNYIDLRSDALFNSPYYFLNPNDVLYIEPNASKVRSSTDALRYTSISLSVITTLTTIASIILLR
jgi:polysaccharide export outer membrane protein